MTDGYKVERKATVNEEGRLDVSQHAHPNNGWVHFTSADLTASQDFILIDVSDTTNYPHTDTDYIHLEFARIHIDADNNGDYSVEVGFLENVDGTNGDFHPIFDVNGNKQAGNQKDASFDFYPNGTRCSPEYVALSNVSENDTAFQTDVNLASTLDPSTADVPSGSGDLALRVVRAAGTIVVSVELSYHTH